MSSLDLSVHLDQPPTGVDQGDHVEAGLTPDPPGLQCASGLGLGAGTRGAEHLHLLSEVEDGCLLVVPRAEVLNCHGD